MGALLYKTSAGTGSAVVIDDVMEDGSIWKKLIKYSICYDSAKLDWMDNELKQPVKAALFFFFKPRAKSVLM